MTRFYSNHFKNRFREIDSKTRYLQQNVLSMLCLSLMGFLSGNLFGTFLPSLRESIVWDGFIIACLLTVSEMISFFCYNPIRYRLKISTYRVSIDRHYKPEVLLKQKLAFPNPLFAQRDLVLRARPHLNPSLTNAPKVQKEFASANPFAYITGLVLRARPHLNPLLTQAFASANPFGGKGKGQVRSCKQDQTRALGGKTFRKTLLKSKILTSSLAPCTKGASQSSYKPKVCKSTGLERNQSFVRTPMQCLSIDRLFKKSMRTSFRFVKRPSMYSKKAPNLSKNLNIFKIGVMIGFFVDAFKVGS